MCIHCSYRIRICANSNLFSMLEDGSYLTQFIPKVANDTGECRLLDSDSSDRCCAPPARCARILDCIVQDCIDFWIVLCMLSC